jgi:UDP-N-acetylmuramate--alanine ligase
VALAEADAVCVTEIYPAREEPVRGASGRLIVDELARVRPGLRIGWAPAVEDGARVVAGWARPGDTVLTLGAGDVDRAVALLLELLA